MRATAQLPLTMADVMQMLAGLIEHGYGEVKVLVHQHRIETVYVAATVKQPGQVEAIVDVLTNKISK